MPAKLTVPVLPLKIPVDETLKVPPTVILCVPAFTVLPLCTVTLPNVVVPVPDKDCAPVAPKDVVILASCVNVPLLV